MANEEEWNEFVDELANSITPDQVSGAQLVIAALTAVLHDDMDLYQTLKDELLQASDTVDTLVAFAFSAVLTSAQVLGTSPDDVLRSIGKQFADLKESTLKRHQ